MAISFLLLKDSCIGDYADNKALQMCIDDLFTDSVSDLRLWNLLLLIAGMYFNVLPLPISL
jgi:hypothetical protein